MYANKITIPSDGNELTFKESVYHKTKKEKLLFYEYTKSKEKLGEYLCLTEKEYEALINRKIGINADKV